MFYWTQLGLLVRSQALGVLNWGWNRPLSHTWTAPDGLSPPSLIQPSTIHADWLLREQKLKLPCLLKTMPRTGTTSLLPHFTGQSKSKGQPRFKWSQNRLHLSMAVKNGNGGIASRHLWIHSTTAVNNITGGFCYLTWARDWSIRDRIVYFHN